MNSATLQTKGEQLRDKAQSEIRYLTADEYERLKTAYEESVIADCPELGCTDVWFYMQLFNVQLMSPEMLHREKARVLEFDDPDPNYLQLLDERIAGQTVCEIPEAVWKVLE